MQHNRRPSDVYRAMAAPSPTDLITQHSQLVERIAHHIAGRLPSSVDVEDLIQEGMIALLDSAATFKPDAGASFETWAGHRIRGAILDEVRRQNWTPRSVAKNHRTIVQAIQLAEQELGRQPTDTEIAEKAGMGMAEYHSACADAARAQVFSLDAHVEMTDGECLVPDVSANDPATTGVLTGFKQALVRAIKNLPPRERLLLSLYYEQELSMREIGDILDVSDSRASKIHGQAVLRLRAELADWELSDLQLAEG